MTVDHRRPLVKLLNKSLPPACYMRRDSMTAVLLELSLPTLDTVVHNSRILFADQCRMSSNNIVQWFLTIGVL